MKTINISTVWLLLTIVPAITADDMIGNRATTRPSTRTAASIHISSANPARGRLAGYPKPSARRSGPGFMQSTGVRPVAMNAQPRQTPEQSQLMLKPSVPPATLQKANNHRRSYLDALRLCQRQRHDCNWWKQHCNTIVFVRTGYYYLDSSYWYPAFGYDPAYDYYDYDGPIYTYGNLLPDQVIANVQAALQETGYFLGAVTGSLSPGTRTALANFQTDYGLIITGAIDEPTVEALGLN
jgi:hypothetical protein